MNVSKILAAVIVIGYLIYVLLSELSPTKASVKASQDAELVCPHCGKRGYVRTEQVRLKKGISGGKATGAILTGGISLVATGLSRKEDATKAQCSNCDSVWHF
jgi:hypothetical protein